MEKFKSLKNPKNSKFFKPLKIFLQAIFPLLTQTQKNNI